MAKGAVVRGTPVLHLGPGAGGTAGGREGYRQGGGLKGMSGTVNRGFEGDQAQQPNPGSGTPYQDMRGNPDENMREVSRSVKGGVVLSENGMNMSDPRANGNGVLFDGVSHATGYRPGRQPPLTDSPVPEGSQKPLQNGPDVLNNLRSGVGKTYGPNDGPRDSFQEMGGVMSRGMLGTSTPSGGEGEMLEDDELENLGAGGAY